MNEDPRLPRGIYTIIDTAVTSDPVALLDAVLRAGVRIVQLRAKTGVDRVVLNAMLVRTRRADASLIVNDDFAAALEADGWHGGQEDLAGRDLAALRRDLGSRLLGVSCGTAAEARIAVAAGADYIGTGPFAHTGTKADAGGAIGVAGIAAVVGAVNVPVVAIGGIDRSNIDAVVRSGAHMAAIISAIALAPDPEATTRALRACWTDPM